jgi:hypothetical protein
MLAPGPPAAPERGEAGTDRNDEAAARTGIVGPAVTDLHMCCCLEGAVPLKCTPMLCQLSGAVPFWWCPCTGWLDPSAQAPALGDALKLLPVTAISCCCLLPATRLGLPPPAEEALCRISDVLTGGKGRPQIPAAGAGLLRQQMQYQRSVSLA